MKKHIQKFRSEKLYYQNIEALIHQTTKIPRHISGSIAVIIVAVVMAVTLLPNIKVEAQQSDRGGPSATSTPAVASEPASAIIPAAAITPAATPAPKIVDISSEETLPPVNTASAVESAAQIQESLRSANIDTFLNAAENQLGKPYIHGNQGSRSFDCSGLVYYCLKQAGVSKARNTAAGYSQETNWEKISSMQNLQKGDLIFFHVNGKKVGHVGIYIGNGEMIDASSSNRKVVKRSCFTSYWEKNFVTARRPLFN